MRLKLRLPQRTLGSRWVVGGASPGLSSRPLGPKSHATLSHQPCHSAAHPRKQKPREPHTHPGEKWELWHRGITLNCCCQSDSVSMSTEFWGIPGYSGCYGCYGCAFSARGVVNYLSCLSYSRTSLSTLFRSLINFHFVERGKWGWWWGCGCRWGAFSDFNNKWDPV